jgi:hypothetical protein
LRALLYQILRERKDLVRRVFATQIQDERWIEGHTGAKNAWTWPELKQAFKMLAGGGLDDTRLCIFVDGLDEYRIDDKRDYGDYDHCGSNDAVELEVDSAARARINKNTRWTRRNREAVSRHQFISEHQDLCFQQTSQHFSRHVWQQCRPSCSKSSHG